MDRRAGCREGRGYVAKKDASGKDIQFPWPRKRLPYVLPQGRGTLQVLAKPRADATFLDIFVEEGEIFQISEKRVGDDGAEYLKLLNHDGWI